jgi:hypothetical protein
MSKQQSSFSLLNSFRATFDGQKYRHRNSVLGDIIASHLYEDLVTLGKSTLLVDRVTRKERVVNAANKTIGKKSRRGDGTFGELVPTTIAITEDGFRVARGEIANIEIGVETKILAKAMIKQIDRVIGDLIRQVEEFKRTGGHPICVGIVGFNQAPCYTSFEGDREHPTDGTKVISTIVHTVLTGRIKMSHLGRSGFRSSRDSTACIASLATVTPFS